MNKVIVLASGGLDSCVLLSEAVRHYGWDNVFALHCSYGQRTQKQEMRAFWNICKFLNLKTLPLEAAHARVVEVPAIKELSHSALTDKRAAIPTDFSKPTEGLPSTYVPFRNAHFLSAAVTWAFQVDALEIWTGMIGVRPLPDTTRTFLDAFENAARIGTGNPMLLILAPYGQDTKEQVIMHGMNLLAPLHLTWSCYNDGEKSCGKCRPCTSRIQAFANVGHKDPILYEEQ